MASDWVQRYAGVTEGRSHAGGTLNAGMGAAPALTMSGMMEPASLPAQEDEIATTVLSGGTSPYTAIVLPREERRCHRQMYTFGADDEGRRGGSRRGESSCGGDGAAAGGVSDGAAAARVPPEGAAGSALVARQFEEWQGCFLHFLKKV